MMYSKTEAGQLAFKVRSAQLSVRQRSAFILFDGVKSDAEVLAAPTGLGISQDDIAYLVKQGFLKTASDLLALLPRIQHRRGHALCCPGAGA